jgi:(p)ppGpp synthase/HD superfamily hydrolase
MHGYSDRINHALAFAAKHHDQQVRRGTRSPYSTQPANLAIILTRYGCDEDTVVAGILLDVVEDYGREAFPAEVRQHRIGEKFGAQVLDIALTAAERRLNSEGVELSPEERRDDLLARLREALPQSQLVVAADALHAAGTLLADLRRTVDAESVWARVPGGQRKTLDWYRRLCDRLSESGPASRIVSELRATVNALAAIA